MEMVIHQQRTAELSFMVFNSTGYAKATKI